MPIDYFVWLIAGGSEAILVDAGYTPEVAEQRGNRIHLGSPIEACAALGYPPKSIKSLVITHAHYDHTGYLHELPSARIHLQERELAFWTGRHAHRAMYRSIVDQGDVLELVRRNFAGSVDLIDGDADIAPGVSVHLVGGHTAGMQVVRVDVEGQLIVLASDASHFYENVEADKPFSITHSTPGMFDAFDRSRELASSRDSVGLIIPGHDPGVRARFPDVGAAIGIESRVWQIA
ncbi:N-acyl homoserine lactonase family protein [Agrococcus sp. Marseille-Q4369]|uniref:N-acyl homoserine lactonase family protein n=1 Tax=Agrococcus sp. Marseille-Q4369 TaxID=2810513 RepID=UPI001B8C20BC|nr:N-acyl homoserine lactonase family protein [Agrococcus sp. Marseille-Q4369]QUW17850.1 N-acyl homoserine lactonase family protein [Agrococcus sp. Marseille-Q4369]